jgi:ribosomal-protein-serine acetyltransferase
MGDAPALRAAIDESLTDLRPWISWAAREPTSLRELAARLAEYEADFAAGARWRYAIVDAASCELLGGASLHPYPGPGALEVGYWVRSSRHGRGIARRAAAALTRHAFHAHGVERVEIWCDPENHASAAVARALGFTHVGTRLHPGGDGIPRTVNVHRLDRSADVPFAADVRLEGISAATGGERAEVG